MGDEILHDPRKCRPLSFNGIGKGKIAVFQPWQIQQSFRKPCPHFEINKFHRGIGIGSAVHLLIDGIEPFPDLLFAEKSKIIGWHRNVRFRSLSHKTHIHGPFIADIRIFSTLFKSPCPLGLHFQENLFHGGEISRHKGGFMAPNQVERPWGRKKSQGRSYACVGWNNQSPGAKLFGQTISMYRTGAPEGDDRYQAGIASFLRNVGLGRPRHGLVDQIVNAPYRIHKGYLQGACNLFLDAFSGRLFIQRHLPAQKIVLVQVSQQQVRVRNRGFRAAPVIADGAGFSA